jgi:hypothetical protein
MLFKYLSELTNSIIRLHETVGFKVFTKYVFFGLFVVALINVKSIIKGTIELVSDINEEIHNEKLIKRDALLAELHPILVEFRTRAEADRILYFEYHNSKENLVGIPFKYIDLILQDSKFGISRVPESMYQDINAGEITSLYEEIKDGDIVYCSGPDDISFQQAYPGTYDLFRCSDGSKEQLYISLPGINQPIGMIVLEWIGEDSGVDRNRIEGLVNSIYLSRINGCILSKR